MLTRYILDDLHVGSSDWKVVVALLPTAQAAVLHEELE